jgi:cytochrome c-type biogenesis protein
MSATPEILSHGSLYALPLVLVAGLVAGLNPCCLAMYPAATASCCATATSDRQRRLGLSVLFSCGAAFSTAVLGVVAALLGRAIGQLGAAFQYGIALIPLVMGFQLLGWIRLPLSQRLPVRMASSAGAAFLAGMVLGIVISPCGTPILASVLSYVAYKRSTLFGAVLLLVYGIGSSAPVALLASAAGTALQRWRSPRSHAIVNSVTGALLVGTSFYLLWRV